VSLETLTCTANAEPHEFTRERKRGVKPSTCPACKAEAARLAGVASAAREEAEHLIGGIITAAAVRAIRAYQAWNREDAWLFAQLRTGEITRDDWNDLRTPCPVLDDLPVDKTWRDASAANLI
jgi:hypothetical protein